MGYIYIRSNIIPNICKLGQTNNIPDRDSQYATSEYIREQFLLVIEIIDIKHNHIFVEKILQKYLSIYHMKNTGGNEFYNITIINMIVPFLDKTNILYNILTNEQIKNLIHTHRMNKIIAILTNFKSNKRNKLQNKYVIKCIFELNKNKRVFIKAPTGFGKTHIYYKIIKQQQYNKILFLTPRKNLNIQLAENKYSFYVNNEYKIIHYSHCESHDKEHIINKYSTCHKIIMTCCYQSNNKLLSLLLKYKLIFDVIIFDEAHFITTWVDTINTMDSVTNHKIFGSATPTTCIEEKPLVYGNIVEKVKVYELIHLRILCNIETIVKKLNNKKREYHDLKKLIVDTMLQFNKRKGIIYVNTCKNAENLHKLMKTQTHIISYIYISKELLDYEDDSDIKEFENNINPCVIIAVGKISYGYDNEDIDFIVLGDQRQSEIDIRQIIGRGLRWNKKTYHNKVLHLLVPLYKDEFTDEHNDNTLKKYLDYIIGECGKEIIIKNNNYVIGDGKQAHMNNDYTGSDIPIEILQDYCTNRYNMYSNYMKFLQSNHIYDEHTYNNLQQTHNWMAPLGVIFTRYPKFNFKSISIKKFYNTKIEAIDAYKKCCQILIATLGKDVYKRLNQSQQMQKINELDNKIPVNFDLYYGI